MNARWRKKSVVANNTQSATTPGGDEGIRTLDLSDANRTLSQLSYAPIVGSLQSRVDYYNTDF